MCLSATSAKAGGKDWRAVSIFKKIIKLSCKTSLKVVCSNLAFSPSGDWLSLQVEQGALAWSMGKHARR